MTQRDQTLRSIIFGVLDAERAKGEDLRAWLTQDIICDLLDVPELASYDAMDFDEIISEWMKANPHIPSEPDCPWCRFVVDVDVTELASSEFVEMKVMFGEHGASTCVLPNGRSRIFSSPFRGDVEEIVVPAVRVYVDKKITLKWHAVVVEHIPTPPRWDLIKTGDIDAKIFGCGNRQDAGRLALPNKR